MFTYRVRSPTYGKDMHLVFFKAVASGSYILTLMMSSLFKMFLEVLKSQIRKSTKKMFCALPLLIFSLKWVFAQLDYLFIHRHSF